jgi:sugar lactone lactonase YvrE
MKRFTSLAAVAVLFAACEHPPTQPVQQISASQFARFDALGGPAACRVPPSTVDGFASYQPFDLPAGYGQRIVASQINDFTPAAGASGDIPDMITLNETGPFAGRFLYQTHEVGAGGAVTVTDLRDGGTKLVTQSADYNRLDGIAWTPWGTLVFAEETGGGLVYEYDPATGVVTPRPAVGLRSHEGLRFDTQGNFYGISESTPGPIYKFVPDRRGDLSSGQLYALKVLDASRQGAAVWIPIDRAAAQVNSETAARAAGASGWGRPEDIEIATSSGNNAGGNQVLYVAVTSENLVLKIDLEGDEAFVTNYVHDVPGFNFPDNLALDAQGNLFITEDGDPPPGNDIWVARRNGGGAIERFASLSDCAAEPTGLYFENGSHTLYVHVQHAGGPLSNDLTIAISPE